MEIGQQASMGLERAHQLLVPDLDDCFFCKLDPAKVAVIGGTEQAILVRSLGKPNDYLIIPLLHYVSWLDLPDDFMAHMKVLTRRIPGFDENSDHNVSLNQGYGAGQRVAHLHWWIIDRTDGSSSNLGLATLARQ